MNHNARFAVDSLCTRYSEQNRVTDNAHLIFIHDERIFVTSGEPTILVKIPVDYPDDFMMNALYLGHRGSAPYYVTDAPDDMHIFIEGSLSGVRELAGIIPDEELALAGLAIQISNFNKTTRFCGKCGASTKPSPVERAKICPSCSHVIYPRISPAIIVLIQKNNSLLMIRGKGAVSGRYGLIAGFIEPCETIEQAVHREVREEAGIKIKNLRYCTSEPWPFPDSLMLGFVADYDDGDITPDGMEVETARWFDRDHLPDLPPRFGITRALIDNWIEGRFDQGISCVE